MKLNVDKIYICHYDKLTDRKDNIIRQLNRFEISNYQFVEIFHKDELNTEDINKKYPLINDPSNSMTNGEKSLALKHVWIIEDMNINSYSSVLVLEDDAVLCEDFIEKFNFYKNQLPNDWDIGWVGSCFNLREPQEPNVNIYKTNRGSRCTHAFCLNRLIISKVIDAIAYVNKPSDHYYNHLISRFNLNNYWFQPALALQSLEFSSSLNENSNHKWSPEEIG